MEDKNQELTECKRALHIIRIYAKFHIEKSAVSERKYIDWDDGMLWEENDPESFEILKKVLNLKDE